jgi:hypothetical protein
LTHRETNILHKQRSKVFTLPIAAQINSLQKKKKKSRKNKGKVLIIYIITGEVSQRNNTSLKRRQVEESTELKVYKTKSNDIHTTSVDEQYPRWLYFNIFLLLKKCEQ